MIIFAENDIDMSNERRIQTVLRLPESLYNRVKLYAERDGRSFNSYVEKILAINTDMDWPKIPKDFDVPEEILNLVPKKSVIKRPSQEVLDNDPKLAYLMTKYGL
ncbi:MAG: Arc family DNA-binding protein [Bacteroidales bacterium]|nr:Arc family DNA-binding protein [Bacteroidales bacterium]